MKYQLKKVFALNEMPKEIQNQFNYYETVVIFEIGDEYDIYDDVSFLIREWLLHNGAKIGETVLIW